MVSYGRFMEYPPVSKVIPLPTKTTCGQLLEPFGAYVISIKRGGDLRDEFPTAAKPPNGASSFPAKIFIETLRSLATVFAFAAIQAGVFIFAGVCTRSRARQTAAAIAKARFSAKAEIEREIVGFSGLGPVFKFQR